jgi:acyl-CoA dehydrogenase
LRELGHLPGGIEQAPLAPADDLPGSVSPQAWRSSISHAGTEGEVSPPLANGKLNFSIAFTEPNAGSDAAAIALSAAAAGDGFRLNGQKIFISAADISDYMLVSTRTDRNAPKREGITAFIVESRSKGLTIRKISKLGMKANAYCEVFFDDVYVPENVLNGLNQGWAV